MITLYQEGAKENITSRSPPYQTRCSARADLQREQEGKDAQPPEHQPNFIEGQTAPKRRSWSQKAGFGVFVSCTRSAEVNGLYTDTYCAARIEETHVRIGGGNECL